MHIRAQQNRRIEQFLAIFRRCRHFGDDPFKWGDEVEHGILRLVGSADDGQRSVRVVLRSPDVLQELRELETRGADGPAAAWMPEYGRWMLESTPGRPFEGIQGTVQLEASMKLRRARLAQVLQPGEIAPTVTSMPLFGTSDFTEPAYPAAGLAAESLFVPDEVIFPHPRFPTLTRNIRLRRGGRVAIRRPRLGVVGSEPPAAGPEPTSVAEADALDHVYADAMAFGMGNCCLQVTMQAPSLQDSRYLYDQLAPLTPLLLALTAATPFLRGWICDDDTRWGQLSQSVDDRTAAERGVPLERAAEVDERLAGGGVRRLQKSRYDGIDCYIGTGHDVLKYNDLPLAVDDEYVQRLRREGVDETLARHVAHLFARDPLVIFGDRLVLDNDRDVDHWENLQSTNWQTLRWKPPPPAKAGSSSESDEHIGWRVEFRSMEVQMTDFENAAFSSFVVILSRAILDLRPNLYIPMSKLEQNIRTAQGRDACTAGRFWFRTDILSPVAAADAEPFAQLSLAEILLGSGTHTGLIPLCRSYLDAGGFEPATLEQLRTYLDFIAGRAEGRLMTTAAWQRAFVLGHEAYRHDGRVPAAAAYDLMAAATEIGEGLRPCPELLGPLQVSGAGDGVGGARRTTRFAARLPWCSCRLYSAGICPAPWALHEAECVLSAS